MTISSFSENQLLYLYQTTGDSQFLVRLLNPYQIKIKKLCKYYFSNPEDQQDYYMDIIESLILKLKTQTIKDLNAWIFIFVRNFCLTKIGKQNKDKAIFQPGKGNYEMLEYMEEKERTEFEALEEAIYYVLKYLSPQQKTCLELFYLKGKSYKEINNITGYELRKIKSYIQNGKRRMKSILEKIAPILLNQELLIT
ncbi:MAG: sigma-70 family RNA polymerase sigma factor [Flammeovirgaceae bacterium]|nr:sigma-70 family RNA polymerase sigma factor [Flammeovirgaceae bacterium]